MSPSGTNQGIIYVLTNFVAEKAILIGVITPEQNKNQAEEYLDELAFLAKTAGTIPIKKITQKLPVPNNKTFIG